MNNIENPKGQCLPSITSKDVQDILQATPKALLLYSTTIKVHSDDAPGALKKRKKAIGRSKEGLSTKIHLISANEKTVVDLLYAKATS